MINKHYAYIDALRGYAILAVIATHTSQIAPALQGIGRKLVDQGARGVELFFLASALTLMMSWHSRNDGAFAFYLRRIFRIAPMFWLGIAFYTCLYGVSPKYWSPSGIDFQAILMTGLFAHGWYPSYFNSVVPGGWSIAVEMSFYLAFPLLAYWFKDSRKALLGILISLVISYFSFIYTFEYRHILWPAITQDYLTWNLVNLWFPNELPVFITGIFLYFLVSNPAVNISLQKCRMILALSFILMIFLAVKADPYNVLRGYLSIYAAYGLVFGLFAYSLAKGVGGILVNTVVVFLGKISFSAYLWHFAVLEILGGATAQFFSTLLGVNERASLHFLCCFTVIIIVSTVLAWVTYSLIEKPMINMGNLFIVKLKSWSIDKF